MRKTAKTKTGVSEYNEIIYYVWFEVKDMEENFWLEAATAFGENL